MAKKKQSKKKPASEAEILRWDDRVEDARDAQDDIREAIKAIKRLLRFVPASRRDLERELLQPLEEAESACMDLVNALADRLAEVEGK